MTQIQLKSESVQAIKDILRRKKEIDEKIDTLKQQAALVAEGYAILNNEVSEKIEKIEGFEVCETNIQYVEELGVAFGKRCSCGADKKNMPDTSKEDFAKGAERMLAAIGITGDMKKKAH